jgi:spermidine/putrescine transport system permease protein
MSLTETLPLAGTTAPPPMAPGAASWLDRVRARRGLRTVLGSAIPVAWVVVLLLVPYALLLVQSFWRLRNGVLTHELTTENYRRLFGTALYPATILYSAGVAVRVTAISLLLAYPLAYVLAFKVRRHKTLLYMAVIIPLWVSYLVRAYAWKIILGQQGILNGLLLSLGVIRAPLTVLLYSTAAVILALTHIYTPFALMPIYAVLDAIPPALKEASHDLYANRWQTFVHVVLPLSLPGVVAGCTFAFVLSMGDFLAPQLLGGNDSALMVSNLVWSLFGVAYNWPLGAAVSVVMLALTLLLLWVAGKVEARGTYGGDARTAVAEYAGPI